MPRCIPAARWSSESAARAPRRPAEPARHDGDAGLDLYAAESAILEPGERASVGTGIAIEIPPGHAGLVLPRSGSRRGTGSPRQRPRPDRFGLPRRGSRAAAEHRPRRAFEIAPGDRIAQLLITPFAATTPVEAVELSMTERGEGGFGSSGR